MAKPRKGGLGKGLDALFMDNENADSGTVTLRLSDIEPNENQPRKHFDERALLELADSIKEHGVLQPLLVRQMDSGVYQLVAGERRWRASRIAGLTEVPVVIHDLTDSQVMEIALIENLQREDLNPIEEARGYKNLIDTYDLTQEQVAKKVGKSRPVVANALRLLSLPGEILPMVEAGDISAGHARALLGTQEKEEMHRMALLIKQGKMSVRDVEQAIQKGKKVAQQPKIEEQDNNKKAPTEQEAIPIVSTENWGESHFKEMELALEGELGRKIKIVGNPKTNIGTIEIPFYNEAEMADIAERLANTKWHR